MARQIERAPCHARTNNARESSFLKYLLFCEGKEVRPEPAVFCVIAGFLIAFVVGLSGKTASLRNKLSHIRVSFVERKWEWLDGTDQRSLSKVVEALEYDDYTKTRRMKPLLAVLLRRIFDRRGAEASTPMSLLIKTVFATAHDGLLRGGEVTSGLLGTDITMEPKLMRVRVDRAKRHRKGEPGVVIIYENEWYGSSVRLMRKWLRARKLDEVPNRFLFPHVLFEKGVPIEMDFTASLTYKSLVGMVRHEIQQLDLDPWEYAAHSFRAGGATDLFLAGRMLLPMIMKYGRWKSMEAALVYYREEVEIAQEASQIFVDSLRR